MDGLQEQLLNELAQKELEEDFTKKGELIVQLAENSKELAKLEDSILANLLLTKSPE